MNIDSIIEIPLNCEIKYEYDFDKNMIRCDRFLRECMVYPANYGYIPNTLGGDGDPLDILIITNHKIDPNTIVECKVLGVLIMYDEKGIDEKIISVPSDNVDINNKSINELNDISKNILNKIEFFFKNYKKNIKGQWSNVIQYENKEYAIQLIKKYSLNHKL